MRRKRTALGLILIVPLLGMSPSGASPEVRERRVQNAMASTDLRDRNDVPIDGAHRYDNAGTSVSSAGDVNGDGAGDVIVGTSGNDGRVNLGRAYVVFGPFFRKVDLRDLGDGGFLIKGAEPGDFTGFSVAGAGDVNGDGLDDVIVGAPWADASSRTNAGTAYVVFGKARDTSAVHLADIGSEGFRIEGSGVKSYAGSSVAGIGDVNRDGLADVALGAPLAGRHGRGYSGSAYVVFGRVSTSPVDLQRLTGRDIASMARSQRKQLVGVWRALATLIATESMT